MMRQFQTIGGASFEMAETQIRLSPVHGITGYDIVRGDLPVLRNSGGDFAAAAQGCLHDGQPVASYMHADDSSLGPGEGYWYLSRARDALGKGTYDSGHSTQVDLRDLEITASGNDCP